MFATLVFVGATLAVAPTILETKVRKTFSGTLHLAIRGVGTLVASCALACSLCLVALFIDPSVRWQTFMMAGACASIAIVNLPRINVSAPKWRRWLRSCLILNALLILVVALYEGVLPILMPGITATAVSILRFSTIAAKLATAHRELTFLKDRVATLEAEVQQNEFQRNVPQVLRDNASKAS